MCERDHDSNPNLLTAPQEMMQPGCPSVPPPPTPPLPPPPPPPAPPPPPPPPPFGHGVGLTSKTSRSFKMRNFNWETLPKKSVIGKHNIWTVDKTDEEYELDTHHIEELFSHKQDQQKVKTLTRQSLRGLPVSASGEDMVSILSAKRSMNVGIFLKQFKRPVKDVIEEIKSGNCPSFPSGKLKELCKLLPDKEEEKQLVRFKGSLSALPEADLFILMLIRTPSYKERLTSMMLKEEFSPLMREMKEFIGTLTAAGKELLESDSLHSVIRLVLKTGNYMNAGGYAGCAVGFKMASLLKLAETKANKPGMNLMHYVVMQCQKVDTALLNFPEQLKHIESAARISKGEIEAEFKRQVRKLQVAKANSQQQEDLKAQMEGFFTETQVCVAEIERHLQKLQSVSDSVAEYFCEDPGTFKLDECCSIFNCFCEKFKRAKQENLAREVAEVQRRHRDRLQCAAKRRSTATCSSRDKEMDGVALESILQNVLSNRISRRRSGRSYGNSVKHSPNSGSLTEITSQINLSTENHKIGGSLKVEEIGRKQWNSAAELTVRESSPQQNHQLKREEGGITLEEDMKFSEKESSSHLPLPDKGTTNINSSGRSFSANTGDGKEDLKDNNEEEAQKLREASKKVLRFQSSRGSVSVDYALENQKSPGSSSRPPRPRTFNEDTERYPDDPTNEDLIRLLNTPPPKRILGRRHTLPTKVLRTEEKKDNPSDNPLQTRDKATLSAQWAEQNQSKQVFDYTNVPPNLLNSAAQVDNSSSAERKSQPFLSEILVPEKQLQEENQDGKSAQHRDNQSRRISDNISPKSPWSKTESSGMFFNFLKRLGDKTKLPSSKETTHKGAGSDV
ncbi:FH2 domain-containing protein 1-like [Antennarius striatus]|uniref:FH2 domain-containing protein 1-like n=1 Tax=Antennarius striatus TaxID=241820 RepID=UPI0035B22866